MMKIWKFSEIIEFLKFWKKYKNSDLKFIKIFKSAPKTFLKMTKNSKPFFSNFWKKFENKVRICSII